MQSLLFSFQGRVNRAKFWLVHVVMWVVVAVVMGAVAGGAVMSSDPSAALASVGMVGGLWYLIECGFLPGTPGSNKYGADPLGTL